MKVKFLKSGEVAEFHSEYCARLIEQGRAVAVQEEPFMPEPVPQAEEVQEEEPVEKPAKGRKKG